MSKLVKRLCVIFKSMQNGRNQGKTEMMSIIKEVESLERQLKEAREEIKKAFFDGFEYGEGQGQDSKFDCLVLNAEDCFIGSDTHKQLKEYEK